MSVNFFVQFLHNKQVVKQCDHFHFYEDDRILSEIYSPLSDFIVNLPFWRSNELAQEVHEEVHKVLRI